MCCGTQSKCYNNIFCFVNMCNALITISNWFCINWIYFYHSETFNFTPFRIMNTNFGLLELLRFYNCMIAVNAILFILNVSCILKLTFHTAIYTASIELMPVYYWYYKYKNAIKPEKQDSNLAHIIKQLKYASQIDINHRTTYRYICQKISLFMACQKKIHFTFLDTCMDKEWSVL